MNSQFNVLNVFQWHAFSVAQVYQVPVPREAENTDALLMQYLIITTETAPGPFISYVLCLL